MNWQMGLEVAPEMSFKILSGENPDAGIQEGTTQFFLAPPPPPPPPPSESPFEEHLTNGKLLVPLMDPYLTRI